MIAKQRERQYVVECDWTTKAGLRAVCCWVRTSHRCGYVAVPPGHRLYGVAYSEHSGVLRKKYRQVMQGSVGKRGVFPLFSQVLAEKPCASPDIVFDVHGSLTFSSLTKDGYPAEGHGWWFGFDCSHAGDQTCGSAYPGEVMRSRAYVMAECERLAEQLAEYTGLWHRVATWVLRWWRRLKPESRTEQA